MGLRVSEAVGVAVGHAGVFSIVVFLSAATGCAAGGGITHRVQPGENLYRIGQAYGHDHMELARINRVPPPYAIKPGDEIFIPDADRQLPVGLITPRGASAAPPSPDIKAPPNGQTATPPLRQARQQQASPTRPTQSPPPDGPQAKGYATNARFSWPIRGRLMTSFSSSASAPHDGIDLATTPGSAIVAAADGKVIFSDRLSSYGNVIIVEHSGGFATVYAHNERNLVRKGARIRRGDKIATLGASGRARAPHLHFEVRKENVARNPLYYLPR